MSDQLGYLDNIDLVEGLDLNKYNFKISKGYFDREKIGTTIKMNLFGFK